MSVEDQFTVFGAAGALLFMLLGGLVLARFARPQGVLRRTPIRFFPSTWRDRVA